MQLCCWKVAHSIAALIRLITRSPTQTKVDSNSGRNARHRTEGTVRWSIMWNCGPFMHPCHLTLPTDRIASYTSVRLVLRYFWTQCWKTDMGILSCVLLKWKHRNKYKIFRPPPATAYCCTALEHSTVCETKPKALAANESYHCQYSLTERTEDRWGIAGSKPEGQAKISEVWDKYGGIIPWHPFRWPRYISN
jgi:hypothetical protein